jgi:hypothetical protein
MDTDITEEGKIAAITMMHKFEIYLGDLARYQEQHNVAAAHYERASLLAPGQGNPYNQMAVLEQLKESSCNALYWYARSIKASSRSFETSVSNVTRLFQANRRWLQEHGAASFLEAATAGVPTKKATADLARARKSAASKRFTARFVDLQYQLSTTEPTDDMKTALIESMDSVVSTLQECLAVNGLGDTLLCRMVVINAYSATNCDNELGKFLVVRFGTAFAERVGHYVDKILDGGPPENPPSIRGLAPLLLICDYVSHFEDLVYDGVLGDAEEAFWLKVCCVANKVAELTECFGLRGADMEGAFPKEYKDLVGFTPFETFINKPDDYLSIEDAKLVVPLLVDSSSKKLSQDSASSPLETRIKLAKLLSIMDTSSKVAQDSKSAYRFIGESEPGELFENDVEDDLSAADVDVGTTFEDEPEDGANMLIYKAPEHGAGPALLVPGAFMMNKAAKHTPEQSGGSLESLTDPMEEQKMIEHRPLPPIPQGFLPPAAATPVAFPTPISIAPSPMISIPSPMIPVPFPAVPPPQPVLQGTPASTPAPLMSPPGIRPPPGLMPPPGFAPPSQQNAPTMTVHQPTPAWDFLSQQATANPFFTVPTYYPDGTLPSSQGSGDPNGFLEQDDPTGLLDSSLLQSLWLDDTNKPLSNNPFLTEYK